MSKSIFRLLFARFWLPAYLLLGVVWLLALSFRQGYERGYLSFAIVAAGSLLFASVFVFRLGRHSNWLARSVMAVGTLLAISGLTSGFVHEAGLLVLMCLIAAISVVDALGQRRIASVAFVAVQLLIALYVVAGIGPHQLQAATQLIYESALIFWIGWLVDRYNFVTLPAHHYRRLRVIAGLWALAGGVFALVTSFPHLHFVGQLQALDRGPAGLVLEQHGIVAGIVALYIGRHLIRGERPALWLALAVFYSQLIKYSLLTPQPLGVVIYGVLVAMLLYMRRGFMRNTQQPTWASRWGDVAAAVGGLCFAALIVLAAVTLAGHRASMFRDIGHMYDSSQQLFNHREPHLSGNLEARLRALTDTLAISIGAIILWSLFRPRSFSRAGHSVDRLEFARLLERYSTNSEDYFKLWPADKQYFSLPGMVGAIAYRIEGGTAFMLADPVASGRREQQRLLEAFRDFIRSHGLILCVLVAGEPSLVLYADMGLQTQQIGSSAIIDVQAFNTTTRNEKWWRWQHNRSLRSGWLYEKRVPPHDPRFIDELSAVSDAWIQHRGRTEQGFALGYFDESYLQACSIHVLLDSEGRPVAFANELPVFGTVRQASVDLIRYVPEADGAMPSLLYEIIGSLDPGRFTAFDLGFVPLAGIDTDLARFIKLLGRNRFSATGLEQFKNKFDPQWRPEYLLYDGDLIDLARIAGSLERLFKVELPSHRRMFG